MQALTTEQVDGLADNLVLDLVAVFNEIEQSCYDLIDRAEKEGWPPEQLQAEFEKLIGNKEPQDENE